MRFSVTRSFLFSSIGMLLFLGVSCRKEKNDNDELKPAMPGSSVFVLNEGNYTFGNASISQIDLKTGVIQSDIFQSGNSRPLGDVLQSATFIGNKLWLVINNSGKIERIDPMSFMASQPITGLNSPRYLADDGSGNVYSSDLASGKISKLDRITGVFKGSIPCPGWTEEMLISDKHLWICNVSKNKIYLADTQTDQLIDSLEVGDEPNCIRKDKDGMLWVLCTGSFYPVESSGSLWKIDPVSRKIMDHYDFYKPGKISHPSRLCMNKGGDQLYFLNEDVFRMKITDTSIPENPLIDKESRIFYGLNVKPDDESVWVSDAKDFQQKGTVYQYSSSGMLIQSWNAGIIPSGFVFY